MCAPICLAAPLLLILSASVILMAVSAAPVPPSCTANTKLTKALQQYLAGPMRGTLAYYCKNPCGGVGDRLKGVMTTLLLAILTRKHYRIHSLDGPPLQTFLEPNHYIPWSQPFASTKILWYSMFPKPASRQLKAVNHDWVLYLETLLKKDTGLRVNRDWIPQLLRTPLRPTLEAMGIDGNVCPDLSCTFQCFWDLLFKGSTPLLQGPYPMAHTQPAGEPCAPLGLQRADIALLGRQGQEVPSYVGMHVRMGGGAVDWQDVPRVPLPVLEPTFRAMQAVMGQLRGAGMPVWLATDSPAVQNASRRLPHCVVWFQGAIVHTDKSKGRADPRGNTKAWLDWFALSRAAFVVGAPAQRPSGFVRTAVWRSRLNSTFVGVDGDRVRVLRRWYVAVGGETGQSEAWEG